MAVPLDVYCWVRSRIAGHLDDTITTAALQNPIAGDSPEAAVSVETNANNTERLSRALLEEGKAEETGTE